MRLWFSFLVSGSGGGPRRVFPFDAARHGPLSEARDAAKKRCRDWMDRPENSSSMVALMGVTGPSRTSSKGKSIMKSALTGIATVGILAVTVGVETANAQSYRHYGATRTYTPQPYPPQSRGSVRREGVLRTTPFADPNSPEATGGGNIGYNRGLPDGGY